MTPGGREELLSLGKATYNRRCAGCHGTKGDGKGPSAMFLNPKPRDFTTGLFKFRSTVGKDSLPTDADLYLVVSHGLWGTSMPSMQEIPDRERWAVIHYLKTFSERWKQEPAGHPISVPAEPPVTPESLENGKLLFQANCALCHGDLGKADGSLAQPGMLFDDWGEPIKPAHLSLPAGSHLSSDSPWMVRVTSNGDTLVERTGRSPSMPLVVPIPAAQVRMAADWHIEASFASCTGSNGGLCVPHDLCWRAAVRPGNGKKIALAAKVAP